jgi:VIT1/CCC1 family predicted Fe2+/Mn2+ transporter
MTRLDDARKAFDGGKPEDVRKAHTKAAIHREMHKSSGKYLRDFVYGALDGTVTTFVVVAGATGATLSLGVILILGFANLIGDGISMAMGNYLGTKSEQDFHRKERERESWEVEHVPEGEREEVRAIYMRKGFRPPLLEQVVRHITKSKKLWVDTMMVEELGILEDNKSPVKSALTTFVAFVAVGLVPLLTYVISYAVPSAGTNTFPLAVAITAITIFAVGSARSLVIKKKWYVAGFEMLVVGGIAAIAAYGIGALLGGLA